MALEELDDYSDDEEAPDEREDDPSTWDLTQGRAGDVTRNPSRSTGEIDRAALRELVETRRLPSGSPLSAHNVNRLLDGARLRDAEFVEKLEAAYRGDDFNARLSAHKWLDLACWRDRHGPDVKNTKPENIDPAIHPDRAAIVGQLGGGVAATPEQRRTLGVATGQSPPLREREPKKRGPKTQSLSTPNEVMERIEERLGGQFADFVDCRGERRAVLARAVHAENVSGTRQKEIAEASGRRKQWVSDLVKLGRELAG